MNSTAARVVLRAAILISVASSAFSSQLYWTRNVGSTDQTGAIRRADTADFTAETIIPNGLHFAYRIGVDEPTTQLFWSSFRLGTPGGISRANLDGSNIQTIIPSNGSYNSVTVALAVDSVHEKIIFSQGFNTLKRANFDGSGIETYAPIANSVIQDIAVDSVNQVIYYSDYDGTGGTGARGRLCRINYDGTGFQEIVSGILWGPVGLGVDSDGGKLYWGRLGLGGSYTGALQRANLDGSGLETIVANQDVDSLALDVPAGKVYWTDTDSATNPAHIWRSDFNGSNREQLPIAEPNIGGITIVPEPATLALLVIGLLVHRRRAAAS
ncbi:MAG: PEP-CTERM sorting domain-containing protein [Planctomycetes bacterium]|nr:PEP-CTERM sorting domain-containing protein [Planctomycetota bacterium]